MDVGKSFVLVQVLFVVKAFAVVMTNIYFAEFQTGPDNNDVYCSDDIVGYSMAPSVLVCACLCYLKPGCMGVLYNNVTKNCISAKRESVPKHGCQSLNGSAYYLLQGRYIDANSKRRVNYGKACFEQPFKIHYPVCYNYLVEGVENKQLSASTSWCETRGCNEYWPSHARLNSGSWWITSTVNTNQYIQVDFQQLKTINGIALMGRRKVEADHTFIQYVTKFKVLLSMDCTVFNAMTNNTGADLIFDGNSDGDSMVIRYLPKRSYATCIRINPVQWNDLISLRMDVLGC